MDNDTIDNLREALKFSPNNIPLKKLLAESLLAAKRLEEAEKEFVELANLSPAKSFKVALADIFLQKGEISKSIVVLEEVLEQHTEDFDTLLLYTKALLAEKSIYKAQEVYQKAISLNPLYRNDELDAQFRMSSSADSGSDDDDLANEFVQKPNINFNHVGGMANVKKEIELKIIKPLLHPELYKAYGKKTGGGILLYGPPGCGKTHIARATAGEVNAKFINVGLNDILDMWVGNSEKNLHQVFELARANTPCVLFFDEIDALGASRSDMKQSSGRHLINQFLQELDGIGNNNEGILILGATNTPWHLDAAFRRPGRFDRIIFVSPPDDVAREAILEMKLKDKPIAQLDYKQLAKKLDHFSGADIEALIDITVEEKLEQAFNDGVIKNIETKDLINAIKKLKPSTQEWFATAKNFALFANDAGLYDDVLTYLKIKK
jgi:transitional endoplasmic reticulum ATPase